MLNHPEATAAGTTRSGRGRAARILVAVLVGLLTLLAAACGQNGSDPKADADPAASGAGFPVSIKHALGTAEIPAKPERIVTMGQGSTETAIALGTVPVGVEKYDWAAGPDGQLPWVSEAVKESGAELPALFTGGTEPDIEAIAELEPDLILATWSGMTAEQYKTLSELAPVVAYPDKPWSTNWDQQIKTIATAMGQPGDADKLIGDIESTLAKAGQTRPNYSEVKFAYTYTDGPGTLGVFLPEEQRVAMLTKLGLKVAPGIAELPEAEGTDSAIIGLENADKISGADVMFTFYSDPATRAQVEAQPLYGKIPAVEKKAVVASDDPAFVTASSMINPLTVPYAVDKYLPLIDEAVAHAGK